MSTKINPTAIALWLLTIATVAGLTLTGFLNDGAAWWQAILSGAALIGSVLFWRMDRERERLVADAERKRAEAERLAKFRSMAILIMDPILEIDSWVRECIRREAGPDDKVVIGGRAFQIVKTVRPIPLVMAQIPNFYQLEGDAAPLQRAVFRYLQLEQLLKEAHDETALVQAKIKMTKETFQSALNVIHEDLNVFLKALHLALWGDEVEAEEFGKRRASRIEEFTDVIAEPPV